MPEAPLTAETGLRPFTVAILAMGGEGGGVLADWLVDAAENADFIAQSTSVPGVAQRTGATIYYLEFFPGAEARAAEAEPVLALMPAPGDIDLVIASELMEAGRAIQRGLVSDQRTTLIFSVHRDFAMTEKITLSDGRADAVALLEACRTSARRLIAADMRALAERTGAHLSAVLLGAVAGSRALPIPDEAFRTAIRAAGVGVEASLAGFDAGLAAADGPPPDLSPAPSPEAVAILTEGERRLTDYQDAAYAAQYRQRLESLGLSGEVFEETARHLALWMSYEDTVRVADLKTRASRLERVHAEVGARPGQVVRITEFLHPRLQEIADTLPAAWGERLLRPGPARRLVEALTRKGRHVETTSIRGYLLLRAVASLRRFRRGSLRFQREQARIEAWLARIKSADPAMALEIARCQTLVKGYGDTHDRGSRSFSLLMEQANKLSGPDGAARLAALKTAALADETGAALDKALTAS